MITGGIIEKSSLSLGNKLVSDTDFSEFTPINTFQKLIFFILLLNYPIELVLIFDFEIKLIVLDLKIIRLRCSCLDTTMA